jgi:hypothetical protein
MTPKLKYWVELLAQNKVEIHRLDDGSYSVTPKGLPHQLTESIVRNLERERYITWAGNKMVLTRQAMHDATARGKGEPKKGKK